MYTRNGFDPVAGTYFRRILNLIILGFVLVLVGCASISTPPYAVRSNTTTTLKGLGVSGVGVGSFSEPAVFENSCRGRGALGLPGGVSHTEYIRKALESELKAAGIFRSNKPRVVLGGVVNKLEFSSGSGMTGGSWDITLTLRSSKGGQMSASEHLEFESGVKASTACQQTADAYLTAVQNLIQKMFQSPGFKGLVQ